MYDEAWFVFAIARDLTIVWPNGTDLTECEPDIQAYFPEKLNSWKNNQSESHTQNWQHFLSRCHNKKEKKSSISSQGLILGHNFIHAIYVS